MSENEQLKLQAYLDGELPERERREVAGWLDTNAEARALLAELQHARSVVRGNELERKLDSTREFYWSGIARGIEIAERSERRRPQQGVLGWLRHHMAQVAGALTVASLAVLAMTFTLVTPESNEPDSAWEVLDPDTGMVSYKDFENGITVVMLYDQSTPDFTSGN